MKRKACRNVKDAIIYSTFPYKSEVTVFSESALGMFEGMFGEKLCIDKQTHQDSSASSVFH